MSKPPVTGMRIDSTGTHAWIDGEEVTREQFWDYMKWQNPDFIWQEMMKTRCYNCLGTECHCCVGCGQPNADIFGDHGYRCVL